MKAMQYLILVWGWWLILSVSYAQTAEMNCKSLEKKLDHGENLQQTEPEQALRIGEQIRVNAERIGCTSLLIRSHILIGNACETLGRTVKSLSALQQALILAEQEQLQTLKATTLANIGYHFSNRGDYPRAIDYTLQGLRIHLSLNDHFAISSAYNHLGSLYGHQGQYDSALTYFFRSYRLMQRLKDRSGLSYSLTNIATIYVLKKNYPEAERYYREGMRSAQGYDMKESLANIYQNLGNLYYETKRPQFALTCLDSAQKIVLRFKFVQLLPKIWMTYAQVYQEQKDFRLALHYLTKADSQALAIHASEDRMTIEQLKYQLFKAQHLSAPALLHLERYYALKDSLLHESKMQEVGRLQGQYQAEQQFNALERQREDLEEKRNRANNQQYLLIFSGVLALMVGLLFLSRLPIKVWVWNLLVFLTFMLIFESVLVYVDYRMMPFTEGKPFPTLMVNFILAAIFTGFHQLIQQKLDLFFVRSAVRFRALRRLKKRKQRNNADGSEIV